MAMRLMSLLAYLFPVLVALAGSAPSTRFFENQAQMAAGSRESSSRSGPHSKHKHASSRSHPRRLKVQTDGGHQFAAPVVHKPKLHRRSGEQAALRASAVHANSSEDASCSIDLKPKFSGITFDYICDVTDAILHNDGDGTTNWELAQPILGCHQYVAFWNQHHTKPSCSVGQACLECSDSPDLVKMTVYLEGGTCEPCGPDALAAPVTTTVAETTTTTAAVPITSSFDLADANGDGFLTRDEYEAAEEFKATFEALVGPSVEDPSFTLADARAAAQATINAEVSR